MFPIAIPYGKRSDRSTFEWARFSYGTHDYRTVSVFLSRKPMNDSLLWGHTGNFPNQSDRFRIVQYIAFRPAEEDYKDEQKVRVDCFHTREQCPVVDEELAGFPKPHLTELGEKILGLRSWKAE